MNDEEKGLPPDFARRSVMAALGIAGLYLTEALVAGPLLWRFLEAVRPERGEFVLSLALTTLVAFIFGGLAGRMSGDSKGIKAVVVASLVVLPFVLTTFGVKGFSEPQLGGSLIPGIVAAVINIPGVFVGIFYGARMRRVA